MLIGFLILWGVIGLFFASSACEFIAGEKANIKQQIFIGFLLGPIIWIFFLIAGVISSFIWFYNFLGKSPSSKTNEK